MSKNSQQEQNSFSPAQKVCAKKLSSKIKWAVFPRKWTTKKKVEKVLGKTCSVFSGLSSFENALQTFVFIKLNYWRKIVEKLCQLNFLFFQKWLAKKVQLSKVVVFYAQIQNTWATKPFVTCSYSSIIR